VKYPGFPSAVRLVPDSLWKNLTSGDDRSDSAEDHGQQEGDNVDCDLTFEASCSSSNPILLTQVDLNDFVLGLNLSKI
jgi:hypothetical protein